MVGCPLSNQLGQTEQSTRMRKVIPDLATSPAAIVRNPSPYRKPSFRPLKQLTHGHPPAFELLPSFTTAIYSRLRMSFQYSIMQSINLFVHKSVNPRIYSLLYAAQSYTPNSSEQARISSSVRSLPRHEKTKIQSDCRRYPEHLHWLPVRRRIKFKLRILAFNCLHGDAQSYLTDSLLMVAVNPAVQAHRSATCGNLVVPRTRTVKMGPRSFCVSGPTLWNSLPLKIRYHEQTLESFKAKLKTYLNKNAYFPDFLNK